MSKENTFIKKVGRIVFIKQRQVSNRDVAMVIFHRESRFKYFIVIFVFGYLLNHINTLDEVK